MLQNARVLVFTVSELLTIECQCCRHIETSQLIICANQLTGFYMSPTLTLNRLRENQWEGG